MRSLTSDGSDATAIWFLQFVGMETRLLRYIEDNQKTISYYLAQLQTFGYHYDTLWLPHDAENKTLAAAGKSIEEIVRAAGYKTRIHSEGFQLLTLSTLRELFSTTAGSTEKLARKVLPVCAITAMKSTQTRVGFPISLHDHHIRTAQYAFQIHRIDGQRT